MMRGKKMIETLKKRQKVFAWGYEDMSGIDREIIEHRMDMLAQSIHSILMNVNGR